MLNQKLSLNKYRDKIIVFYSSSHPQRRTNAVFLICAWSMLCLNRTPEEAFQPFRGVANTFVPWVSRRYMLNMHLLAYIYALVHCTIRLLSYTIYILY